MNPDDPRQTTRAIARLMFTIMAFVLIGLIYYATNSSAPDQSHSEHMRKTHAELVLTRTGRHYYAEGSINGTAVVFFVDTGANAVSIPAHIAEQIGLKRGGEITIQTANGETYAYATRLDNIQVGPLHLNDVRAIINPHVKTDRILLGMSFLRHMDFSQTGDQLRLRQRL